MIHNSESWAAGVPGPGRATEPRTRTEPEWQPDSDSGSEARGLPGGCPGCRAAGGRGPDRRAAGAHWQAAVARARALPGPPQPEWDPSPSPKITVRHSRSKGMLYPFGIQKYLK
jgi:hypothetical protein